MELLNSLSSKEQTNNYFSSKSFEFPENEIEEALVKISSEPEYFIYDNVVSFLLDKDLPKRVNNLYMNKVISGDLKIVEANKKLSLFYSLKTTCQIWIKLKENDLLKFPFLYCKTYISQTDLPTLKKKFELVGKETKDLLDITKNKAISLKDLEKQVNSFDSTIQTLQKAVDEIVS